MSENSKDSSAEILLFFFVCFVLFFTQLKIILESQAAIEFVGLFLSVSSLKACAVCCLTMID